MKLKILVLVFFVVLLIAPTGKITNSAAQENVILIVVDDLSYDLGKALFQGGRLPHISALSSNATVFTQAYVTISLCCPSRSTILTGQYPHNHGVLGNLPPTGGVAALDDTSTIATWMHDAGYSVGYVGKYLNGYGSGGPGPLDPLYIPPGYDYWAVLNQNVQDMYNYRMNINGAQVTHGSSEADYQTDVVSGLATGFINSQSGPFFLFVYPTAPHVEGNSPYSTGCSSQLWGPTIRSAPRHAGLLTTLSPKMGPAFNETNVSDKPSVIAGSSPMTSQEISCNRAIYQDMARSVLAIDDMVGDIVSALSANGETANIIFTSDNGYFFGEHRLSQKLFSYTEGIRVPLIISRPSDVGRTMIHSIVLNNDIAPTIAEIAGITPAHQVDGRSLIPLIENRQIAWRQRFLIEYLGEASPRWPFIPHFSAIRDSGFLYVGWETGEKELYNLSTDPSEISSLHTDPAYAQKLIDMQLLLDQLSMCVGAGCAQLED